MAADPCKHCKRRVGENLHAGGIGAARLNRLCPRVQDFREGLASSYTNETQMMSVATTLGILESKIAQVGGQSVYDAWFVVLGHVAAERRLPVLLEHVKNDPRAASRRAALVSAFAEAPCGFLEAQEPENAGSVKDERHAYLACDRDDEWAALHGATAPKSAVPLIILGSVDEAPDRFHARLQHLTTGYDVVPVLLDRYGNADDHEEALRSALAQVSYENAQKSLRELIGAAPPRLLLLHSTVEVTDEDAWDRELPLYYARLAGQLTGWTPSADDSALVVAQCISYSSASVSKEAIELAKNIRNSLDLLTRPAQARYHVLTEIPPEKVEEFLGARKKEHLWPAIKKKIGWDPPADAKRKPSSVVYRVLKESLSEDARG